jgi:hypothetical protein
MTVFISTPFPDVVSVLGTKATMIARVRPTWTLGERFHCGVLSWDASVTRYRVNPIIMDIASKRWTDGSIINTLGGTNRTMVGGVPTFTGATFTNMTAEAKWVEIAITFEVDVDPRRRRVYYRYDKNDPWTVHGSHAADVGAATGFALVDPPLPDPILVLGYAGDVFSESIVEQWLGGLSSFSLRAGISGTGASAEPGGTEVAEWHATPPRTTYTDPYGNLWTVTGDTWRFGSVI